LKIKNYERKIKKIDFIGAKIKTKYFICIKIYIIGAISRCRAAQQKPE